MRHPGALPLERWGRDLLERLQTAADRSRAGRYAFEFLMFGLKQGWACLFGGLMLALLLGTHLWWPDEAPVARYDFLVIGAVLIQLAMLGFRLESLDEAKVILLFHIAGTVMELFKTAAGSWIYPEPSLLRIGEVPLFSGFMYAAVGSYIARIWRIFEIRFTHYPPLWTTWLLAAAIYVNFFAHHWIWDFRWLLFAVTFLLFWRTRFWFTPDRVRQNTPVTVRATASDNSRMNRVDFRLGTRPAVSDRSAPYQVTLSSTGLAEGPQTITVTARARG